MKIAGTVYDKMFVHYDDDGNVYYISNVADDYKRTFAIDINVIGDFLNHRKLASNYKIDYFYNLANGIVNEEQNTITSDSNVAYIIPVSSKFNNEITLVHDKKNKAWTVTARPDIKKKLEVMSKLSFFFCKKDDPHYLYSYITVDLVLLSKNDIIINFQNEFEKDLSFFSVVVEKKFNSYGIIKHNE